jgi:predicted PurR-regulated permease PerM
MRQTLRQLWQNPYVRLVTFLLGLAAVAWFFYETRIPWFIFLLSYTVAYMGNPLVTWLQHHHVPRWAGVLVALSIFGLFIGLTTFVVTGFAQQATTFIQQSPDLITDIARWYENLPRLARRIVPAPLLNLFSEYGDDVTSALEGALGASSERLADVGSNIFISVLGVIGGLVQSVVFLILTIFFLYDFPALNHSFFRAFPKRHHTVVIELFRKLDLSVGGYIRGQLLVAVIVGFAIWLGMTLLGVPFALGIGFLAGAFNIVPYLGPVIAFVPAALLTLTLGWSHLIATAAVFLAVNFIDGNIISPFIFSLTIKLHPVTVLTSITIGASLFGFFGAIIAVPTAAFLTLLYNEYYLTSRWYDRDA